MSGTKWVEYADGYWWNMGGILGDYCNTWADLKMAGRI
jgi:hypothetical protein